MNSVYLPTDTRKLPFSASLAQVTEACWTCDAGSLITPVTGESYA